MENSNSKNKIINSTNDVENSIMNNSNITIQKKSKLQISKTKDQDKQNKGTKSDEVITYENCLDIISLLKFNSQSDIFALERNKGLSSVINNIYASFGGEDVYKTIEEKASNFLYLIIKNHVFIDGNKRIAATLFIYFLEYYNILFRDGKRVIDNNTLVALTLLIAESNPKEKQILIDLVMNFLV